jgi:hypothetical protein
MKSDAHATTARLCCSSQKLLVTRAAKRIRVDVVALEADPPDGREEESRSSGAVLGEDLDTFGVTGSETLTPTSKREKPPIYGGL